MFYTAAPGMRQFSVGGLQIGAAKRRMELHPDSVGLGKCSARGCFGAIGAAATSPLSVAKRVVTRGVKDTDTGTTDSG